jgi:hypothetical protein
MTDYFYKTRLTLAIFLIISLSLNCSGCARGESGPLKPQKAENIKIIKTRMADDTAQIEKDGKIFQIYGTWGNEALQRLTLIITNSTDVEFQFNFKELRMELASQEALELDEATDDTNVDRFDENPNNDYPTTLVGNASRNTNKSVDNNSSITTSKFATLVVPPDSTKILRFSFLNTRIKENRLHAGSYVFVTIPTGENPSDLIKILFNCAESSFLPF